LVFKKTKTGKLGDTLDLPAGPFPVVIIIGSGPTDHDGNQPRLKNDSLKQLGKGLAAKGIAALRYDGHGTGKSAAAQPKEDDLRFDMLIADAIPLAAPLPLSVAPHVLLRRIAWRYAAASARCRALHPAVRLLPGKVPSDARPASGGRHLGWPFQLLLGLSSSSLPLEYREAHGLFVNSTCNEVVHGEEGEGQDQQRR
jgi:hypothetical protein